MDQIANINEQRERAKEYLGVWDKCPENGEFTPQQLDELSHIGYRLAELVDALYSSFEEEAKAMKDKIEKLDQARNVNPWKVIKKDTPKHGS